MGLLPPTGESLTGLGDEDKQHDDGDDERDNAAGERPLVEVLVHHGVRVQPLEPLQERVHLSSCYLDTGTRRQHPPSLANPTYPVPPDLSSRLLTPAAGAGLGGRWLSRRAGAGSAVADGVGGGGGRDRVQAGAGAGAAGVTGGGRDRGRERRERET
jgi:hypothetical protein